MDSTFAAEQLESLIAIAKKQSPREAIKTLSGYTFGVASETKSASIKMVSNRVATLRRQAEQENAARPIDAIIGDWFEMMLAS